MKTLCLAAIAGFLLASVPFAPSAALAAYHVVAPADEYFGHQRLSILGMRNMLHDLQRDSQNGARGDESVVNSARAVEDAMHDWQSRYPLDPWLPRYIYQLDGLYHRVDSDEAHERAERVHAWLIASYPNSVYARHARENDFNRS